MKTRTALLSCFVLVLATLFAAPVLAQANCKTLSGIIAGHYELGGPEGDGWYGWAYMTFGKDTTLYTAKLVDLNNGYKDHPFQTKANSFGNFAGDEILTFTIGPDSFQMAGHFICTAGSSPFYCGFSEEGKVVPEAGTGQFAGMRGNISIHGSAVVAGDPTPENPWLWIAQMTGSVCK